MNLISAYLPYHPFLQCLVGITVLAVLFSGPFSAGWFAWHPPLEAIGVAAMIYGVMLLQPTSTPQEKAAGLARHQLAILSVGLPSALLGVLAVMYNKYAKDKHHFTSWHAVSQTLDSQS